MRSFKTYLYLNYLIEFSTNDPKYIVNQVEILPQEGGCVLSGVFSNAEISTSLPASYFLVCLHCPMLQIELFKNVSTLVTF